MHWQLPCTVRRIGRANIDSGHRPVLVRVRRPHNEVGAIVGESVAHHNETFRMLNGAEGLGFLHRRTAIVKG